MTATVEQAARIAATRWADPLTTRERGDLARPLARTCGRSWRLARARGLSSRSGKALTALSIEMSALHMDVTGLTAVPFEAGAR